MAVLGHRLHEIMINSLVNARLEAPLPIRITQNKYNVPNKDANIAFNHRVVKHPHVYTTVAPAALKYV